MLHQLRRSLVLALVSLAFFGLLYGLLGVAAAQLLFRHQADGSLTQYGSTLIGQNWNGYRLTRIEDPKWFHGRPDADNPLQANGSEGASGSGPKTWPADLGPRSRLLRDDVAALVRAWHAVGVDPTADLVTNSGSELDPDISPQDAYVQVPMVARARGVPPATLRRLIARATEGPELGFLGAPVVNVLQLNEAVARLR